MEHIFIVAGVFFASLIIHQVSSVFIGKTADNFPAPMFAAAIFAWIVIGSMELTIYVFFSALMGHLLSVYISRSGLLEVIKKKSSNSMYTPVLKLLVGFGVIATIAYYFQP